MTSGSLILFMAMMVIFMLISYGVGIDRGHEEKQEELELEAIKHGKGQYVINDKHEKEFRWF